METSLSDSQRMPTRRAAVTRIASRPALAVLFAAWAASLIVYFDAFLNAATIPPTLVPHNPMAANAVLTGLALTPIALIATMLPIGALLALTRFWLPFADRATLGVLTGAWIVTLDVATLGNRYAFVRGGALAPLLGAAISTGAIRIVITAALRRWNVQSRARTPAPLSPAD
jgi:hypothetical protein